MKYSVAMVLTLAVGFLSASASAGNSPPAPSAPAIITKINVAATTQVSANDPNVGDTETFTIARNPQFGSATITTSGLVSYTPQTDFSGNDSMQVRVTDQKGATAKCTIPIFVYGGPIPTSLPEHVRFDPTIVAVCQSTITLKYPATVEAYFLDEGAGYHNYIGWYDVTRKSNVHTIWNDASSVHDLLGNTDGTLHTGDRVELGTFSGGETLGFYLHNITGLHATLTSDPADNSDGLKHVLIMAILNSDFLLVSFEDKAYQSDYDYNDVMMLVRVGRQNVQNWIDTSTLPLYYVVPDKYQPTIDNINDTDTDGDGVPDSQDQFPTDPSRAFISFVPSPDPITVAYEDEFPAIGDYDFNDAIVAYHVAYVTNATNQLVEIRGDAKLLAHGAANSHDWHLRFIGTGFSATATVTQTPGTGSSNTAETRSVSSTTSIDVSKNEIDLPMILNTGASLPWHSGNTVPGWFKGDGDSATFSIVFAAPIDPNAILGAPFDPYLIVRDNGLDIHMPNQPLRKNSTNPNGARTFINPDGMPWAMIIPTTWQWPVEKTDIRDGYPHFAEWAASGGSAHADWYTSPSLAHVVQTPQAKDHSIWAGSQTPNPTHRSAIRSTVAQGFGFATIVTRKLELDLNERAVVSLLPLNADPADAVNAAFTTFRMQGTSVQFVTVPAAWDACIAVVTPIRGSSWTTLLDFHAVSTDLSAAASTRLRVATQSCKVKVSTTTNTASVLFTGFVDPSVLTFAPTITGTLYLGGIAIPFGGSAPLKLTAVNDKAITPFPTFTLKGVNLDASAWTGNGVMQALNAHQSVTLPVTLLTGGKALFGQAAVNKK